VQIVAPRGTITDRNSHPLVENRPSFNILLYREFLSDMAETERFVTSRLGIDAEEFAARIRRARKDPLYRPIVIKEDVGIAEISTVEAHRSDHPEIQLGPQPRRLYRHNRLAAHVLGYVGEVSEAELADSTFPGVKPGDLVGKSGVERIYDRYLQGTDGTRQVIVDSLGRELGVLGELEAVIGGELRLTLDLRLQESAERILQDRVGAVVALDPRNGEILALASAPSFDPNRFSSRLSERDWNELLDNPDHPLQNRAIQNSYSPGSIFKLVMAVAGLEEGALDDGTRVYCNGAAEYYNRTFHCWSKGHGFMDLENAIKNSCNIYFYELGRKIGIDKIALHGTMLGFGERTGIDLPGERAGIMPSPEWKLRARGERWYAGETISVSIGQGAVSTTPLQLLRAVSAIAMQGRLVTPHVMLRADRAAGDPRGWPGKALSLHAEKLRRIADGMWASVNAGGTGGRARVEGLDVCGKTGTVQVVSAGRTRENSEEPDPFLDHSWFVGFADRDDPQLAVAVFVEHGGKGGLSAAPLAREIFQAYLATKTPQQPITQAIAAARSLRP
ncbi:MAG: penicillin-binding protein 2, partial [Acidobacteriota bacterium]